MPTFWYSKKKQMRLMKENRYFIFDKNRLYYLLFSLKMKIAAMFEKIGKNRNKSKRKLALSKVKKRGSLYFHY